MICGISGVRVSDVYLTVFEDPTYHDFTAYISVYVYIDCIGKTFDYGYEAFGIGFEDGVIELVAELLKEDIKHTIWRHPLLFKIPKMPIIPEMERLWE